MHVTKAGGLSVYYPNWWDFFIDLSRSVPQSAHNHEERDQGANGTTSINSLVHYTCVILWGVGIVGSNYCNPLFLK